MCQVSLQYSSVQERLYIISNFPSLTGKLSAVDISRLIERVKGKSLRLVIRSYPQLHYSLSVTGKLSSVIIPQSLPVTRKIQTSKYHIDVPFDSIFRDIRRKYSNDDTIFFQLSKRDLTKIIQENENRIDWKSQEEEWRKEQISFEQYESYCTGMFRVIITDDTSMINEYYSSMHEDQVIVIDCSQSDLEKVMDSKLQELNHSTQGSSMSDHSTASAAHPCLVLLHAHLLSDSHRSFVALRAIKAQLLLVFVVPYANPDDLILHAKQFNSTIVLQVSTSSCIITRNLY